MGGCVPSSTLSPPVCSKAVHPSRKWRKSISLQGEIRLVPLCQGGSSAQGLWAEKLRMHLLPTSCPPWTSILTQGRKQSLGQLTSVAGSKPWWGVSLPVTSPPFLFSKFSWALYQPQTVPKPFWYGLNKVQLTHSCYHHVLQVKHLLY